MSAETVRQAEPSTCVRVARAELDAALALLDPLNPEHEAIRGHVETARSWLPSWLIEEWDKRMTAWMERERARGAQS